VEEVLKIIVLVAAESLSLVPGVEKAGPTNDDNSKEVDDMTAYEAQFGMTKPMEVREVPVPYGKEGQ